MWGAIIGDVIGSIYEWNNIKTTEFPLFKESSRFTDDTVLTIAIADALTKELSYETSIKSWANKYPKAGYGGRFKEWMTGKIQGPYNSWGNGSAMRVSPIGYLNLQIEEILDEAKKSADVTHNHPEGVKGAQAVAAAIHLARNGSKKEEIKFYIEHHFNYNLSYKLDHIRDYYEFDVSCQGSVPEAIIAFLEGEDMETAIRLAISIGGDSDTIASITGAISSAFWPEIPKIILEETQKRLPNEMLEVIHNFCDKFHIKQ